MMSTEEAEEGDRMEYCTSRMEVNCPGFVVGTRDLAWQPCSLVIGTKKCQGSGRAQHCAIEGEGGSGCQASFHKTRVYALIFRAKVGSE